MERRQELQVERFEKDSHQLVRENRELRSRISQLERCEGLAREWQKFGQYTANILKNEIDTYEVKVQLLQEQVEKLSRDNKELREMCLYLDHSETAGDETKLTPPESAALLLHTNLMSKLSKRGASVPRFSGLTSHTTLRDERARKVRETWSGMNTRDALVEMKKRVERLEQEKLELVKSLSAAHLLTSSHPAPPLSTSQQVKPPPDVDSVLLAAGPSRAVQDNQEVDTLKEQDVVSPDLAINAATLLDICRRLDAAEQSRHTEPMEEAECTTLRVLLNIAWQKIKEEQLKRTAHHATEQTHDHTQTHL